MKDSEIRDIIGDNPFYQDLYNAGEAAGTKRVVDYFSKHWMGSTSGMLLYEIPDHDRDLLEEGIVPNNIS